MIVLGIDTSTSFAAVALMVEDKVSQVSWYSRHNHGREAMPAVMRLLTPAGLAPSDIDAVAVALGPGGFSAVRVGIATGQGLVEPTQARLVGIPTHLIQAYPWRNEQLKRVVSLIPIGRNQVSYAVYSSPFDAADDGDEIGMCGVDEVSEIFDGENVLLCGEGAVPETATDPTIDPEVFRSSQDLIRIAAERLKLGAVNPGLIEPIYSRPPTITSPRAT